MSDSEAGGRTVRSWAAEGGTITVPARSSRHRDNVLDTLLGAGIVVSVYPDPRADLHDAHLLLWIMGACAVLTVATALVVRRWRLIAVVVQVVVLTVVLVNAVPRLHRDEKQQRELARCHYGVRHCVGVRRLT